MSKIFLPSCKVSAKFPRESRRLREYLTKKDGVKTVGYCKIFCGRIAPEDTAVVIVRPSRRRAAGRRVSSLAGISSTVIRISFFPIITASA